MKTIKLPVLIVLTALCQSLLAQQPAETSGGVTTAPGAAMATETTKASATVVGVDRPDRIVTLKGADGKAFNVHAGPEVRNFDQIKVGDTVAAEYTQALSLDLRKHSSGTREDVERESAVRAPAGAMPGGAVGREVQILADVVSVNKKNKMVTLRGPHGNLVDLKVQDPAQLKNVKKGDQVEATYTESLAVAVVPTPKTSGK